MFTANIFLKFYSPSFTHVYDALPSQPCRATNELAPSEAETMLNPMGVFSSTLSAQFSWFYTSQDGHFVNTIYYPFHQDNHHPRLSPIKPIFQTCPRAALSLDYFWNSDHTPKSHPFSQTSNLGAIVVPISNNAAIREDLTFKSTELKVNYATWTRAQCNEKISARIEQFHAAAAGAATATADDDNDDVEGIGSCITYSSYMRMHTMAVYVTGCAQDDVAGEGDSEDRHVFFCTFNSLNPCLPHTLPLKQSHHPHCRIQPPRRPLFPQLL
ncbi:hypothetical protein BDP27DRAFT_1424350 [Rhodocollybia butyracea]|uniref:Uncharacterized protein n=1 Tax=Rhodocollybia butyracea TaxID=206335 RepID=A0A9P5U4S1_9AGAR|nr:hypothetical protein BDP27DRAFT_1424350 [Rhodocollybia butyracea]